MVVSSQRADVARVDHNPGDEESPEWQVSRRFGGETVVGRSDASELAAFRDLVERMEQVEGGDGS